MPRPILRKTVRPCVWMTAGLVSYKLCDRDFDCEHCPLDEALRGEPRSSSRGFSEGLPDSVAFPLRFAPSFPEARLYTSGHLCLRAVEETDGSLRGFRLGLDAFAAALLGVCHGVRPVSPGVSLQAGESCCQLDLGAGWLSLGAPLESRAGSHNPVLETSPSWAVTAPYGDGWLLELETDVPAEGARDGSGGPAGLLDPGEARERARLDLRHLRRRLALHWLAEIEEPPLAGPEAPDPGTGETAWATIGPSLADGGVPLLDLRRMLGDRKWLALLQELVH
jgi:glycine cleavage system H lipoate-binding protein